MDDCVTRGEEMKQREIIEQCGLSDEMREHLVKEKLSKWELVQLIENAPVALQRKMKLLEQIAETEDLYQEAKDQVDHLIPGEENHLEEWCWAWEHSASRAADGCRNAIEALQVEEGEFLWMEEHWFDFDWLDENRGGGCAFQSLEAALQAIRDMIEEEEWDEDTFCWSELTKWSAGKNGVMENKCRYYLIRDEIVYYSDGLSHRWPTEDVVFSTPFQPGDIVTLDPRPFAPPIHAVLLETQPGYCELRGLYQGFDDAWHDVAIYHRHGWDDVHGYFPILSPAYRLSKCSIEELIPEELIVLQAVHDHIGGDERRGLAVDRLFFSLSGVKTNNILEWIRMK